MSTTRQSSGNRANAGLEDALQFTLVDGTVTNLLEYDGGRWKSERISANELYTYDGKILTKTETEKGRTEVTTYGDLNGSGVFAKVSSVHVPAVPGVGTSIIDNSDHSYGSESSDDSLDNDYHGGAGNDTISGRLGHDSLHGESGNDSLYGDEGNDDLGGGNGDDSLSGGVGDDILRGDIGKDSLEGGENNDSLYGNKGADVLRGDSGSDVLYGGADNDRLYGGQADDVLSGDLGNDSLEGGGENDALTGGLGRDSLNGGAGSDRFIFTTVDDSRAGSGNRDFIADFQANQGDLVDLSAIDANGRLIGDQSFSWIGSTSFSGKSGELRFGSGSGLLQADLNGDRRADFEIAFGGVVTLGDAQIIC